MLELENAEDTEIDITLVNNTYIHELNKKYRKIDSPTDVLSFSMEVPKGKINAETDSILIPTKFLGDIYISLDKAREQISPNETIDIEVSRLLIHGILHILNYKHGKKMEERQNYYLQNLKDQVVSNI